MQPYLESLTNYIDGAPPWTPTNKGHGITSRPLKHDHEVSPRGSWDHALTTDQSYSINQVIFIMHIILMPTCTTKSSTISTVESIPNHPSQTMNKNCVSYQYHVTSISNHFMFISCQESFKSTIHNSYILLLKHIHSFHILA